MKSIPHSEFEVMEILWQKGESTVKEVQAALSADRQLAYTTIATLLDRLRKKGFVGVQVTESAYMYRPLCNRDDIVRRKLDEIVSHVLRGDISALAMYIAEKRRLSPKQIEQLEEMVSSTPDGEDAGDGK